jgi:segregation and condensation protein B
MASENVVPEIKQVLGAMLFGARQPVALAEMRRVLQEVAETHPEEGKAFAKTSEADLKAALAQLKADLAERRIGLSLVEVAGGFRYQTDAECGPWLRHLLDIGKPTRLSRPTLETLAIIAYRQPVTRAEIEAVRGVTVDTIVRNLLELQLIRIVGRSPLPGRPLLLGTTQLFLEHFGLKDLKELPGIEQLCRKEDELTRRPRPAAEAAPAGAAEAEEGAEAEQGEQDSGIGVQGSGVEKESKQEKTAEKEGLPEEAPAGAAKDTEDEADKDADDEEDEDEEDEDEEDEDADDEDEDDEDEDDDDDEDDEDEDDEDDDEDADNEEVPPAPPATSPEKQE